MLLPAFAVLVALTQDAAPTPAAPAAADASATAPASTDVTPPVPPAVTPADLKRLSDATEKLTAAVNRLNGVPEGTPAPVPHEKHWTASAGVGLTWLTGNVSSVALVANAAAKREGEHTIFNVKLFAGYGDKNDGGGVKEILLYNAGATAQFDYRFTHIVSMFIGAGLDTDHVKSVEIRGYGELGVGAQWFDIKAGPKGGEYQKLYFKTDLAARVQPESRFQYYPFAENQPDVLMVGPSLEASLRYGLSASTYFSEDFEFLPNVIGASRFLVNSASKLSFGIIGGLAATITFTVHYDSAPAEGKVPTDTIFTAGLDANY